MKDYHVELGQIFKLSAAAILVAAILLLVVRAKNERD
jgi:hypothetical protein